MACIVLYCIVLYCIVEFTSAHFSKVFFLIFNSINLFDYYIQIIKNCQALKILFTNKFYYLLSKLTISL